MISLYLYNILQILSNIYLSIINGIGKIKLQLTITIIQAVFYIPLCVVLCKYLGVIGIILSGIIMMVINCITYSVQCNKLINETVYDRTIWFK